MKTLVVTDINLVVVLVVLKRKELILALLYLNLRRIVTCSVPFSGDYVDIIIVFSFFFTKKNVAQHVPHIHTA